MKNCMMHLSNLKEKKSNSKGPIVIQNISRLLHKESIQNFYVTCYSNSGRKKSKLILENVGLLLTRLK